MSVLQLNQNDNNRGICGRRNIRQKDQGQNRQYLVRPIKSENHKGRIRYVGMEIQIQISVIFVSQPNYARRLLNKFGFGKAYNLAAPFAPGMMCKKL